MAKIEHFAIYANDAPALKDFYVDAMGMHVVLDSGGNPPGYFLADDGGMAIEIIGRPRENPGPTSVGSAISRSGSTTSPQPARPWRPVGSFSRRIPSPGQRDDPDRFLQRPRGNRVQIVCHARRLHA